MTKNLKTTKEVFKYIEQNYSLWDKFIMHASMNWLRYIIYNLPSLPYDIYLSIKWFIQRGKRGFSDNDVWDFDYYLSRVISQALHTLKEDTLPTLRKSFIDKIIYAFETEQKIIQANWIYTTEKNRIKNKKISKSLKIHLMTKEECKRYRIGWKLFKQHFKQLWS